MKFLWNVKDGGPESKVWCWGLESKRFGSVLLMLFKEGSREAYHTHAFNAISWILSGALVEQHIDDNFDLRLASFWPVRTRRQTYHKVTGLRDRTWVLSFRGPWVARWSEYVSATRQSLLLTHGRVVIAATHS